MADKKKKQEKPKRPSIKERDKIILWAAAAGRCTFCNRLVTENEDLGEPVPIGELAHNVGWSEGSPRGEAELTDEDRAHPENLLLLCRNCHKPADDAGVVGLYGVDDLRRLKQEHEERIKFLTDIGSDRAALVVRVVGAIRGAYPELTFQTVMTASTAEGLFPKLMPGAYRHEIELDIRGFPNEGTAEYFKSVAAAMDDLADRVADGIRREDVSRLAVFGFARIPILVYLGALLDDKISTYVFQRQRVDDLNAWRWPTSPPRPPDFHFQLVGEGSNPEEAAIVLNLSGHIAAEELPGSIRDRSSVFVLTPSDEADLGPSAISSRAALENFERSFRFLLATIERDYGKLAKIALFAAIPVSCAITVGRTLMPNVSPALQVYDRDQNGRFFMALEVKR
jgi:hypothetical protein